MSLKKRVASFCKLEAPCNNFQPCGHDQSGGVTSFKRQNPQMLDWFDLGKNTKKISLAVI